MYCNHLIIFILVTSILTYILCSKNPGCKCEKGDVQHSICTCKEGNETIFEIIQGENRKVTIDCKSTLKNDQWPLLLEGVNFSGNYKQMNIQGCPVPAKSYKWILNTLLINSVKIIQISFIREPFAKFSNSHFEDMKFLERLTIMDSDIKILPEKILEGVPNIEVLILRKINLSILPDHFFNPLTTCVFLDISGNNLNSLNANTFTNLTDLRTLQLSENKFENLKKEVFTPLKKLRVLDLSSNGISQLPEDLFDDLSLLNDLSLNLNNISSMPETIFDKNKSLKKVSISYSHNKQLTTIPFGLFSNLNWLEKVQINENNLTGLPEDLFMGSTNLTQVSMNKNSLVFLPGKIFSNAKKLKLVDISKNKIILLNDTLFEGLKELKTLLLQNNNLASINNFVFQDLEGLEELRLENNKLTHIEGDAFRNVVSLKKIHLSNNQLTLSAENEFSVLHYCFNIEEIYLENNLFEDIPEYLSFRNKLTTLDLSHNRLRTLTTDRLRFMSADSHSVKVDLRYNKIQTIDFRKLELFVQQACEIGSCPSQNLNVALQGNSIECDCYSYDFIRFIQYNMSSNAQRYLRITDAEKLSCDAPTTLNNTFINRIPISDIFCHHEHIQTILKSSNESCPEGCSCSFRSLDEAFIVNCSNVKSLPYKIPEAPSFTKGTELLLQGNRLDNINQIASLLTPHVTKLSLANNKIRQFDGMLPPSIKVLELNHNNLTFLNKKAIDNLNRTNYTSITFHNNPWKCDCDNEHFLRYLQARRDQIPFLDQITCKESRRSMYQISIDELCQISFLFFFICGFLAFFGLIFGVITFIYTRYNQEIKIWMYAHKILLCLVTEKEVDRDKTYDAFVTFAQPDEQFVAKHLLPGLEDGEPHYKLCVHYRDWLVGDYIPQQIVRSVNSSRRTIVVLSANFLKSIWCQEEFNRAHLEEIKERRARLIVILLKELEPDVEIPEELKAYLSTKTYLKWGDPWFWEKLRYAMPHQHDSTKRRRRIQKVIHNSCNIKQFDFTSDEDVKTDKILNNVERSKGTFISH